MIFRWEEILVLNGTELIMRLVNILRKKSAINSYCINVKTNILFMKNKFKFCVKPIAYGFSLVLISMVILLGSCEKMQDPVEEESAVDNSENQLKSASQIHTYMKLFDGGPVGYHSFRIPSIIKTTSGTLIAFAECRRYSSSDFGDINLVYKRSTDNGVNWSALGEIAGVGAGTWGNPTAVTDATNGRIWIFFNWNSADQTSQDDIDQWGERKVYSSYSDNDGVSWSTPLDRTSTLLPSGYTWDAMGPGVGIQTTQANSGRLIIPATRRNIYSDDHGATWQYATVPSGTGEATIVEKLNGTLMRNDRPITSQWELSKRRRISSGTIAGGFSSFVSDDALLEPKCEASILRYNMSSPDRIIFLNSASTVTRCKMRARISYDDGATWPISRKIYDWLTDEEALAQGKGGYSSMTKTADYCVGALIEIRESTGNYSIEFHKFNLAWILDGTPEP